MEKGCIWASGIWRFFSGKAIKRQSIFNWTKICFEGIKGMGGLKGLGGITGFYGLLSNITDRVKVRDCGLSNAIIWYCGSLQSFYVLLFTFISRCETNPLGTLSVRIGFWGHGFHQFILPPSPLAIFSFVIGSNLEGIEGRDWILDGGCFEETEFAK